MSFKHLSLTITVLLVLPFFGFAQEYTYFQHGDSVKTVAYSPVDSSIVASGGDSGAVKLWDLRNDTVTTLEYHSDIVNAVAFSADGQLLVSGSDDYTCKLWNVPLKQFISSFEHINDRSRSQIKDVVFSPDNKLLATAGVDVKLWDVSTLTEIGTLEHGGWVLAIAFSSDGELLATGDENGQVNVWDIQTRKIVAQLQGDPEYIAAVKFSSDNRILAGAGYERKIKLWEVQNWEHLGTLDNGSTASAISFSPDRNILASTGYESVNLWEVNIGGKIATLTGPRGWMNAVAFSPDGSTLLSGGDDETLQIWDVTPYRSVSQDIVRIIYFLPRGRSVQPDMWTKLDTLIRGVQGFYADQMEFNGFGQKTFDFETDEKGETLVYRFDGQFSDWYYRTETVDKVYAEVDAQFDMAKHVYFIVVDISSEFIGAENTCGVGGGYWHEGETVTKSRGGYAIIPASGRCFDGETGTNVTAHELGHAFGLEHDFRDDTYIMSYGASRDQLSQCAAGWLDASRFFNTSQTAFNESTRLQMLTPLTYPPNAKDFTIQFEVTDADGIHQVQLLIPTTPEDLASGVKLHSCGNLPAQNSTVEFDTPTLTVRRINDVILQAIDVYGNITRQKYTLMADDTRLAQNPADVNGDGMVNIQDLVLVSSNFGQIGQNSADVNADGVVNIADLVLVAGAFGNVLSAPALHLSMLVDLTTVNVQQWLDEARQLDRTDDVYLRGIAVLEQLFLLLPQETALLINYPNPFNPETWIPYQLAEPAEVTLYIYSMDGALVRTLAFGYQPAGRYQTRSHAAHWDGRNTQGEPVASGVYFYTLTAGDFTATRKMLIKK